MIRRSIAILCAICAFTNPTFVHADLTADLATAKSEVTADSTLLSQWISDQLKIAVPFNSTAGNVVPKQLKVFGIEVGVEGVVTGTKMDVDGFHSLPTSLVDTKQITVYNRLPMPAVLGHAKIGLPWGIDAGVRVGGIPTKTADNGGTHMSVGNSIFGLDLRKALIEEGVTRPFGLTVGVNFTRAKGHIDVSTPYTSNLGNTVINGTTYTSTLNATGSGHSEWDTKSFGAQAILNKQILIFNPYIGASANRNVGSVSTSITNTGNVVLKDTNGNPLGTQDLGSTIGTGSADVEKWDVRALAGMEITLLPFVKLGLLGEYAGSRKLGGSVGLRAQFR